MGSRNKMDAAARRRELRRRKILQNAEGRIKKLTDADVRNEATFVSDDGLKISAQKNVNNCSTKVDQNCDKTTAPREKVLEGNCSSGQNEPTTKRDGHVRKERVANETNEQQNDGKFNHQTRQNNENLHIKENVLDENFSKHEDEPAKLREKVDGYARKERHKISQNQNNENETELINTEPEAVDNKIPNVRSVLVMILAILCFSKSLYLPALSSILGSSWFLEIFHKKEVNTKRISQQVERGGGGSNSKWISFQNCIWNV